VKRLSVSLFRFARVLVAMNGSLERQLQMLVNQVAHDWGALGLTQLIMIAVQRLEDIIRRMGRREEREDEKRFAQYKGK